MWSIASSGQDRGSPWLSCFRSRSKRDPSQGMVFSWHSFLHTLCHQIPFLQIKFAAQCRGPGGRRPTSHFSSPFVLSQLKVFFRYGHIFNVLDCFGTEIRTILPRFCNLRPGAKKVHTLSYLSGPTKLYPRSLWRFRCIFFRTNGVIGNPYILF
jgi:hypothetical protein